MAEDTGGRAFFDSNAFGKVFDRVVEDTSAYYVLGYSSTNPARDGRYRRIRVGLRRTDVKLDYRAGYYAGRDFAHSTREDREQQLEDQLSQDLSATDLSTYVTTGYFRVGDNRFFVPVSVVVPGYQVPVDRATDKKKATIDVLGVVRDARKRPVARIRDTMKLAAEASTDCRARPSSTRAGSSCRPAPTRLKVVVREKHRRHLRLLRTRHCRAGPAGDAAQDQLGRHRHAARDRHARRTAEPARPRRPGAGARTSRASSRRTSTSISITRFTIPRGAGGAGTPVKVVTSIAFFRGKARAFETMPVEATELAAPITRRRSSSSTCLPVRSAGLYTCQVNIIDDVAGAFAFPRLQLYVKQ